MAGQVNRRRLLGSAAAAMGLALLGKARDASALTMEPMRPDSRVGLAYANRCQAVAPKANAEHEAIATRLRAELVSLPSLPAASEPCPVCGCPVVVTRQDL